MKALPVLLDDSPLCRLMEIDSYSYNEMLSNETYRYCGAGPKGRILKAVRDAKATQGRIQMLQVPAC